MRSNPALVVLMLIAGLLIVGMIGFLIVEGTDRHRAFFEDCRRAGGTPICTRSGDICYASHIVIPIPR